MEGSGKMVITAVGMNSQTGIIMTLLGATKGTTSKKGPNTVAPEEQINGNFFFFFFLMKIIVGNQFLNKLY